MMRIARVIGMAALALSLRAGDRWAGCGYSPELPDITIYVDGAGSQFVLAKCLANQMLAAAGVRAAWRVGAPQPEAAGGLVVGVRWIDAPSVDYEQGALAHTWPFAGGVRRIVIFDNRVAAIVERSGTGESKLMAHVLVHEIGHVLERLYRHSPAGVMKAHWSIADFQAMKRKPLPFAEEDLEWIHREVTELHAHAFSKSK